MSNKLLTEDEKSEIGKLDSGGCREKAIIVLGVLINKGLVRLAEAIEKLAEK